MCSLDALNEGHTLYGKWTLLFRGWRSLDNNIVRTKSSLPMVKCQFSLFRWCSTLWWSKILVNPLTGDVCNGDRWVIVIFPFHVELQKHIIPRIPGENFKSCAWLGWVLKVLDSKCQPDPYPWSIPKNGKLYLVQVRYTLSERTGQSSYIYIYTHTYFTRSIHSDHRKKGSIPAFWAVAICPKDLRRSMQIQELHLPSWAAEIATVLNGYCKGMGQDYYITPTNMLLSSACLILIHSGIPLLQKSGPTPWCGNPSSISQGEHVLRCSAVVSESFWHRKEM